MMDAIRPKVFQVGSAFGIRSEAVVPGAGRIEGPHGTIIVPVDVFWAGESWSRTVVREFSSRENAEAYLAENRSRMMTRAEKQFGNG